MITRNITDTLITALSDTPVVLINGARQTGKSTLVESLPGQQNRKYISLDDPTQLFAAQSDPKGFIEGLDGPIVIDEAQYAPELLPVIKLAVDKKKQPGRFLLTGSADILFLPKVSDSLAGRMEIITMQTCSQGELLGRKEDFISSLFSPSLPSNKIVSLRTSDYLTRVALGGYPALLERTDEQRRDAWFSSYINGLLQKDVQQLFNIEGLTEFPRLLKLLASRTSSILNVSELSRTSTIANTTLHRYLSILQTMFLVRLVPPWSSNTGKRLVKAPKLFFLDTGLACFLAGYNGQALTNDGTSAGHFLENFVVSEFFKQQSWSATRCQLYHFRTPTGREVDIVLEDKSGRVIGIEVKSTATIRPQDFNGLKELAQLAGNKFLRGIVLYSGDSIVSVAKNLHAIPIEHLWLG